jgi:hypothetical protein
MASFIIEKEMPLLLHHYSLYAQSYFGSALLFKKNWQAFKNWWSFHGKDAGKKHSIIRNY